MTPLVEDGMSTGWAALPCYVREGNRMIPRATDNMNDAYIGPTKGQSMNPSEEDVAKVRPNDP